MEILYSYDTGGVYMDADAVLEDDLDELISNNNCIFVTNNRNIKNCFNGFIATFPKNPLMKEMVDYMLEVGTTIQDQYYFNCEKLYTVLEKHIGSINLKKYNYISKSLIKDFDTKIALLIDERHNHDKRFHAHFNEKSILVETNSLYPYKKNSLQLLIDKEYPEPRLSRCINIDLFDDKVDTIIAMCCYNRVNYIERCFKSLNETIIENAALIIIDDASNENTIEYLRINNDLEKLKIPIIYLFKPKNTMMFNSIKMAFKLGVDAGKENIKRFVVLDSDTIHSVDWLIRMRALYDKNPKSIISGFNTNVHHTNDEYPTHYKKMSIGGISMYFTREMYDEKLKSQLINKEWDWKICNVCHRQNIPFYATKPSVIEHIGMQGLNNNARNKYDKSIDFIQTKIPNIAHFVFGFDKQEDPFLFTYYLAIFSAYKVNYPDIIYFHYHHEPHGEWWEKAKQIPGFTLNKIDIPTHIGHKKIIHRAHKADKARMDLLMKMGGVYLDIDTICVRPYRELLLNKVVLGKQDGHTGICNAVMMTEPNSDFFQRWMSEYEKHFVPKGWNEASITLPYEA